MWRLCIEDDEANRTIVNLVRKEYTIGRAEENAVRLTERNVSRRHAVLRRTEEGWRLEDLESETGSFVNERRVVEPTSVEHRDKIRIGDYDISLLDSEREAEEAAADKQTETVPASVESDRSVERHDRLVVIEGPNPGTQYPLLDKKLLIGRGEECDLALPDTSVSRVHASLLRDEHGRFHISDQKSSNGVRVNGMEITKIPLYAGDVVELGDVHLQFVPKGSRFDESALRPATAARSVPSKGNGGSKWWVGVGLLGVIGGVVWFGSQTRQVAEQLPAAAPTNTIEESVLLQAEALLNASDTAAALTLLQSLPSSSPQRASGRYRSLVQAWGDQQLQKAELSKDPAEQRELLRQVADFQEVGAARSNRARELLHHLELAHRDAGAEESSAPSAASTAITPNALPPASTTPATRPPPVAAPRPAAVAARPSHPAPQPAAPSSKPNALSSTPVSGVSPSPVNTPSPQPAVSTPAPQAPPAAPTSVSAPSAAPKPAPVPQPAPPPASPNTSAPKPAPSPAAPPQVSPAPAPAPAPSPPVNPPVVNWPGAAP